MKNFTINTTAELLEFIKRDEITTSQGLEIVCKALNVISLFELTKEELIKQTEYFINKFNGNEQHPLFLNQLESEFNINDLYDGNHQ